MRTPLRHPDPVLSWGIVTLMAYWAIRAAAVDRREFRLPHALTGRIYWMACILAVKDAGHYPSQWLVTWAVLTLLHALFVVVPPHGLGGGDLRLIAGLSVPIAMWGSLPVWLWLSYSAAAVVAIWRRIHGRSTLLAFGPYLVAGWIVVVMGECARVALAYSR